MIFVNYLKIPLSNCKGFPESSGGYPFFCFAVTTYPDNTKDEDRIYMCAGKIFKYLDTQKKDLDVVHDDVVTRAQTSINSIVRVAKDNESKAK